MTDAARPPSPFLTFVLAVLAAVLLVLAGLGAIGWRHFDWLFKILSAGANAGAILGGFFVHRRSAGRFGRAAGMVVALAAALLLILSLSAEFYG